MSEPRFESIRIESYNSQDLARKMSADVGENQTVVHIFVVHSDPSRGETIDVIVENKQPEPFPSAHRQPR